MTSSPRSVHAVAILAAFSGAVLTAGCDREQAVTPSEPPLPEMSVRSGVAWTLTAWYWDNGWVRLAAVDDDFLPDDLRIGFNVHNWGPYFPPVQAAVDNIVAYGDIDLTPGLIEDFRDGTMRPIWGSGGGPWWFLDPTWGFVADIPQGSNGGIYRIVGFDTPTPVVHGEFDVQLDFALHPSFHTGLNAAGSVMLCLWDESYMNGICGAVTSGAYRMWRGTDAVTGPEPAGFHIAQKSTGDLMGKLRLTRTRIHRGPVVEAVSGTGNYTTTAGDWRTFNFTARRYEDGTVDGQWERIRRDDGNAADSKSHGVVACFTIVGNEAWLGGIATGGLFTTPPNRVLWRVVDNGQGEVGSPDQISTQTVRVDPNGPAWYCGTTPADPPLNEVEAGTIRISR